MTRAEHSSCAVHFPWCLFIVPKGDDCTLFIKRESKKTTLSSSPTSPFLSTSAEPCQVPGSPAGSQGGGIHSNRATRLPGRAIFLQKPSWHTSRAQCTLSIAQILDAALGTHGSPHPWGPWEEF